VYCPMMSNTERRLFFYSQVKIVSPAFEGKTLIQRHRLVNDALRDEIAKLHAFSQVWGIFC